MASQLQGILRFDHAWKRLAAFLIPRPFYYRYIFHSKARTKSDDPLAEVLAFKEILRYNR